MVYLVLAIVIIVLAVYMYMSSRRSKVKSLTDKIEGEQGEFWASKLRENDPETNWKFHFEGNNFTAHLSYREKKATISGTWSKIGENKLRMNSDDEDLSTFDLVLKSPDELLLLTPNQGAILAERKK